MAVRYWYEAATEGFTSLRLVKAVIVTALAIGGVVWAFGANGDEDGNSH
jgi:hypothetical protein